MRRLIINADDFGLTRGVNRAIAGAHSRGVVTSATMMANSAAFDDAVQQARSSPGLGIGCHIVLVDGLAILPPDQVSTLIVGNEKRFREGAGSMALSAVAGRLDAEQMREEATAQIRKLQAAGLTISHIDTHKHVHILPQVLRPLLRAAIACGVRAIRNPFGRIGFPIMARRPELWQRYGQFKLLQAFAGKFRQAVRQATMFTTDGSLGISATGYLDDALFRFILENLPEGTWELVCHPGYDDADLQRVRTRLHKSREAELRLLTASETRALLARNGVELISYRDLVTKAA